jgi:hypothetical protein
MDKGIRLNEINTIQEFVNDLFTMADFYGDEENWEYKRFIHMESGAPVTQSFISLDMGKLAREIHEKWKARMEELK